MLLRELANANSLFLCAQSLKATHTDKETGFCFVKGSYKHKDYAPFENPSKVLRVKEGYKHKEERPLWNTQQFKQL